MKDREGDNDTREFREQQAAIRAQELGLAAPRFEEGRELLIAGFARTYTPQTLINIPSLWQQFVPYIGRVPGQANAELTYGVCLSCNSDGGIDYMAGVEVSATESLSEEFSSVRLAPQRYAVFTHVEHVSSIAKTIDTIWGKWLPVSGLSAAAAPCFERYTKEFNSQTGMGGIEIWLAIQR